MDTQTKKPLKVTLFGTHPKQSNGYSKVVYEISRRLANWFQEKRTRVKLSVFGFQRQETTPPDHRAGIPPHLDIFDALANENPRQMGFGVSCVRTYLNLCKPDVIVIYNDLLVITSILAEVREAKRTSAACANLKVLIYLDQVYLCQRQPLLSAMTEFVDGVICFTEFWQQRAVEQGITKCIGCLPHGFSRDTFFPVDKAIARRYLGIDPDSASGEFVILNMNRNQPRKRWDICIKAFVRALKLIKDLPDPPKRKLKLLSATQVGGAWHLNELLAREAAMNQLPEKDVMDSFMIIGQPQAISDFDVNVLYNVCDIGINTCDGEGFGLCNFEQAGIGKPQIVPAIGGFLDFFDDSCSIMVQPVLQYYVDHSRDNLGGEAQMCRAEDFADAIIKYITDEDLCRRHGLAAREKITKSEAYDWDFVCKKFISLVDKAGEEDTTSTTRQLKRLEIVEENDGEQEEKQQPRPMPNPKPRPKGLRMSRFRK